MKHTVSGIVGKFLAGSLLLTQLLFSTEEGISLKTNIAWVDMSKLYTFCVESRDIKMALSKKKKEAYKKINSIEKKILYKKNQAEGDVLTYRQQKNLEEELLFLEDSLKAILYDEKIEMTQYKQDLSANLLKKIYLTISEYARQQKIDMVIDKGEYYYYENLKNNLDITDVILKKLK